MQAETLTILDLAIVSWIGHENHHRQVKKKIGTSGFIHVKNFCMSKTTKGEKTPWKEEGLGWTCLPELGTCPWRRKSLVPALGDACGYPRGSLHPPLLHPRLAFSASSSWLCCHAVPGLPGSIKDTPCVSEGGGTGVGGWKGSPCRAKPFPGCSR